MRGLSETHPDPNRSLYTVFFRYDLSFDDIDYYAKIKANKEDPDAVDIYILYNYARSVIGMQVPTNPSLISPEGESEERTVKSPGTFFNLNLSEDFPIFPTFSDLLETLKAQNR